MSNTSVITDLRIAKKYLRLSNGARDRGLEFDLSLADVKKLLNTKRCFYTGVKLDPVAEDQKDRTSFDRKDPKKGYVKGNVVACSYEANQFKSTFEHKIHDSDISAARMKKALIKMIEVC